VDDASSGWITVLLRLPLFYNPDKDGNRAPVEDEKFLRTADEIAHRFGGGTLFRFAHDAPRGFWWDRGIVDQDVLALVEVDVPNTADSRAWLRTYAEQILCERFQQKAIYLKFVGPVDQLIVDSEVVEHEG